jgi:hypothetical protein
MTDFGVNRTLANVELQPISEVPNEATLRDCARMLDAGRGTLIAFEPARVISARDIVRAVADGFTSDTPVHALPLEHVFCMPEATDLDQVFHAALAAPARRVIVQTADGRLLGRLTIAALLRAVFAQRPWIEAFRFALHIENTTEMERER